MKYYLIPFVLYLVITPLANYLLKNPFLSYTLSTLVVGILLIFFWKHYKLKFRFDIMAIITGILIFLFWVLLEGKYPLLFKTQVFITANTLQLIIRVIGFIIITSLVEELFTRGFLIRYLVSQNWRKVPIGKFTWLSFIITVLFFGLSHSEWLQGLVAGILLNLLYYRSKSVGSCIVAHGIANLLLIILI